tara:strand:+ start:105 stop:239 length:135 start_codon:yes stop_codon:yes gene_type:complete
MSLSVPISEIDTNCGESENLANRKRVERITRAEIGKNILAIKTK